MTIKYVPGQVTSNSTGSLRLQRSPAQLLFFQAEDGIRDVAVTGVQTCALPISAHGRTPAGSRVWTRPAGLRSRTNREAGRSEERRVGKECRSRGSPYH